MGSLAVSVQNYQARNLVRRNRSFGHTRWLAMVSTSGGLRACTLGIWERSAGKRARLAVVLSGSPGGAGCVDKVGSLKRGPYKKRGKA